MAGYVGTDCGRRAVFLTSDLDGLGANVPCGDVNEDAGKGMWLSYRSSNMQTLRI